MTEAIDGVGCHGNRVQKKKEEILKLSRLVFALLQVHYAPQGLDVRERCLCVLDHLISSGNTDQPIIQILTYFEILSQPKLP